MGMGTEHYHFTSTFVPFYFMFSLIYFVSFSFNQASKCPVHLKLCMLLVHQRNSVSRLSSLEIDDGLVGILHWVFVDPGLDLLLSSELQHLLDLGGRSDGAAAEFDALDDVREGGLLGELVLRCTTKCQ